MVTGLNGKTTNVVPGS